MTPKDIEAAAAELITSKIKNNEIVEMSWAVRELISSMGEITGDGSDFHFICADYYAWRVVKKAIGKYDISTEGLSGNQPNLDGFEHMQAGYTMKRGKKISLIPVSLLSDEELDERADVYETLSSGLLQHAKELRDFVKLRRCGAELAIEFQSEVAP